jgi:hypothetical protein
MAHSTAHLNPSATSASSGQVMGLKASARAHGDVDAGGCQLALYLVERDRKGRLRCSCQLYPGPSAPVQHQRPAFCLSARKLLGFDLSSGIHGQNTFLISVSQEKSVRIADRCYFLVAGEPGCCSTYAATVIGSIPSAQAGALAPIQELTDGMIVSDPNLTCVFGCQIIGF